MTRVTLAGVSADYGSRFSLGPVTTTINPGVTCLVGANGAGKSTLFRLIAGVQRRSRGTITFEGGSSVGFVPQDPDLPGNARCSDLLFHVAWLQRCPRAGRPQAVRHALESVGLADHADTRIKTLSGGMRRRLAIAQAIVATPDVLLLDEPTVGLDPVQRIELRDVIRGHAEHAPVVVSTHLLDDVQALGGVVMILARGRLAFVGSVSELVDRDPGDGPGETPTERAVADLMRER